MIVGNQYLENGAHHYYRLKQALRNLQGIGWLHNSFSYTKYHFWSATAPISALSSASFRKNKIKLSQFVMDRSGV